MNDNSNKCVNENAKASQCGKSIQHSYTMNGTMFRVNVHLDEETTEKVTDKISRLIKNNIVTKN